MQSIADQLQESVQSIAERVLEGEHWANGLRVLLAVKRRWLAGEVDDDTLTEAALTAYRCCEWLHERPQLRPRWYAAALVTLVMEPEPDYAAIRDTYDRWALAASDQSSQIGSP